MRDSYERFLSGYLNAFSWPERKDGPPLELLDQLNTEEKAQAEDALIARLSSWRDDWPIIGLGHLHSQKALPYLYGLLRWSFGSMKAQIATAIWKICDDEKMLKIVIRCSRYSLFSFSQIDIIYCLLEFPQATAKARLEKLTRSRDYLVAYNAKRALEMRRRIYGR